MMAPTRGATRWAVGLIVLLFGGAWAVAQQQSPEGKTVAEVLTRNTRNTPTPRILAEVQTRTGRPYSLATVQADVARLMGTRLFANVTPYFQLTADDKVTVVFE